MPRKKTHEEFVEQVKDIAGNEYTVIGNYEYANQKIKMFHNECKEEFEIRPNNFLQGKRCSACRGKRMSKAQAKPLNKVKRQLKEKHNGTIEIIGEYTNTHTKTDFKCLTCNHTFSSEPNSVLRLSGCPKCKVSKGEKLIAEFLKENNIRFKEQKRFKDCVHKRPLIFDFYLLDLNTLIEYDGLQHSKPIEYFGGVKSFEELKYRDSLKDDYAKRNNIRMVRVSYKQKEKEIIEELESVLGVVTRQESKAESSTPKS
ncbi:HNH endonuclease [Staphylococcus phage Biyabeda-mokiny_2]|nr:HNH endonuclease [Staphylococcus phage Biyabeda-mokiny_2]